MGYVVDKFTIGSLLEIILLTIISLFAISIVFMVAIILFSMLFEAVSGVDLILDYIKPLFGVAGV